MTQTVFLDLAGAVVKVARAGSLERLQSYEGVRRKLGAHCFVFKRANFHKG